MSQSFITDTTIKETVADLGKRFGSAHQQRIERGVAQCARAWQETDGSPDSFKKFCEEYFVADAEALRLLLDRLEEALEQVDGHLHEIARNLRRWTDVVGPELPQADDLLALFEAAPDLEDQFYRQKIAFLALLNLNQPTLEKMTGEGQTWSSDQWAEARIARRFGARMPQTARRQVREILHEAEHYVARMHIPVGSILGESGKSLFPEQLRLLVHWQVREEIKGCYGVADGLERQRALRSLFGRYIDGSLPRAVLEGTADKWEPRENLVNGRPCSDTIGDKRYLLWLNNLEAARIEDQYSPEYPTALARKFDWEREISRPRVREILTGILAHPLRSRLAEYLKRRIGRDLEPHDIYFEDVVQAPPGDELDRLTRERYPDLDAFRTGLPDLLQDLGFPPSEARFLAENIAVETARGSGHAMPMGMPQYPAWLRTSGKGEAFGWDAFQTAMHELGHNVEMVYSCHGVPRPALRRVPNIALTEAFAFLYQSLALDLLGVTDPQVQGPGAAAIQTLLGAWQIAGPALLDLEIWEWLYAHPQADARELREQVLATADVIWKEYYQEFFGNDSDHLPAAYQHMIAFPLYLADYVLGHVAAHQIRAHMQGRELAQETARICSQGRLTPDLWMERAVGSSLSSEPLFQDAARFLETLP